ncbi:hypothetical protein KDL01_02325 [Actinospica durhamensis]|uniref:Uncharacterized protein n=1 Tax=Actinospica durhamensis TaxID=1508375 RepID=A0A941EJR5_9ACTN|nr:hypothetical protein [Actinospica durhamensis]MBR7832075.1 hypothetical protein [Actinospica durhamensis]
MPENRKMSAYATDGPAPADLAQASLLAERYLVPEVGLLPEGARLHVVEFASCFTVVKITAPPPVGEDGIPLHPAEPGGGVTVIDKETGAISFWPSWGESFVAEKYAEAKAAGEIEYVVEWPTANT